MKEQIPAAPAIEDVETPAGLADLDRVRRNAARAAEYCRENGLRWRPHVKTHKSLTLAQLQLEAGASGLTVATPHEAEVMAAVCSDILLAYPPVGARKVQRLVDLPDHVDLKVGLDSAEVLVGLAEAAAKAGRTVGILVEFDAGMGRIGVGGPEDALSLARLADSFDGVSFEGLMFYPGHIRVPRQDQGPLLEALATRISAFISHLSRAGLPPDIVSGGSSPTLWDSHRLPGLTEVRPGTCIYNDRDMLEMGVAGLEEVAYTVLASVVSVAVPGQAVVDAGSKALAKESFRSAGSGFGVLLDRPGVTVKALSEEHGILDLTGTDWVPRVGDRVRIVPNHVCVSVNLQDRLWGLESDHLRAITLEARGR
ncbi:MAG: alanine racemase [Gemmatimonadota bacterium]|nr:alanine racemase [Gemmatimonadota bacterium]